MVSENSVKKLNPTSTNKQEVIVGGWGEINCDHCGEELISGVISLDHGEICTKCLKEKFVEVKQYSRS